MRRLAVCATVLALALNTPAGVTSAPATPQGVTRVEEDWQLVIGSPSEAEVGPQITTCMSASSDPTAPFVAFDLNYREYPNFLPGGMQVQYWNDDSINATASLRSAQLLEDGETITWTQSMTQSGSSITYRILNGQSDTWDAFGGGDTLNVTFNTSLTDLSGYSPDISASNSGATWQSNRVTSLTIVKVRYYVGDTLVATDSNPRSISLADKSSGTSTAASAAP
jgi:hypothetical protein